jgi:hypothetical protein
MLLKPKVRKPYNSQQNSQNESKYARNELFPYKPENRFDDALNPSERRWAFGRKESEIRWLD